MRTHNHDRRFEAEKDKIIDRVWAYAHLGMYKESVIEAKKLIRLYADDASSYRELALCYEEIGRGDKAEKCYKYIMRRFPNNSSSYVNLGYYYERTKKRKDLAAVCYEKALEVNPNDKWALNNMGVVMSWEGNWKEAANYYKMACRSSESEDGRADVHFLHNLAWAYYRCKKYDNAVDIYNYLANECPDKANVFSELGLVNFRMKKYRKAFDLFGKALSLCPGKRDHKRLYDFARKKIMNRRIARS